MHACTHSTTQLTIHWFVCSFLTCAVIKEPSFLKWWGGIVGMLQYIFINMSFCYRMFPYYLLYNKIHTYLMPISSDHNPVAVVSLYTRLLPVLFWGFFAGDLHYNAQIKEHRRNISFKDQCNLPRAAQITACFKACFCGALNNAANRLPVIWRAQKLVNCVTWFILLLFSHTFCAWKGNSFKCIYNDVRRKNNFAALILHCTFLVNPNTTILMPKDGFTLVQAVSKSVPKF